MRTGKLSIIAIVALVGLMIMILPSLGAGRDIFDELSEKNQQDEHTKHSGVFDDYSKTITANPSKRSENGPNVPTSVFTKASGSVVKIEVQTPVGTVQGSGVVYYTKSRGEYLTWEGEESIVREGPISHVVTNAHVVDMASNIRVVHRGASYKASVEWADDEVDLASLIVCGTALPATPPHSAVQLKMGEKVFAIGSPLGLENAISEGIISGKRERDGVLLLQTTAPISPGSSGGGLFDVKGRLVGITTFKVTDAENLSFAIDAGQVKQLEAIIERRPTNQGMHGG